MSISSISSSNISLNRSGSTDLDYKNIFINLNISQLGYLKLIIIGVSQSENIVDAIITTLKGNKCTPENMAWLLKIINCGLLANKISTNPIKPQFINEKALALVKMAEGLGKNEISKMSNLCGIRNIENHLDLIEYLLINKTKSQIIELLKIMHKIVLANKFNEGCPDDDIIKSASNPIETKTHQTFLNSFSSPASSSPETIFDPSDDNSNSSSSSSSTSTSRPSPLEAALAPYFISDINDMNGAEVTLLQYGKNTEKAIIGLIWLNREATISDNYFLSCLYTDTNHIEHILLKDSYNNQFSLPYHLNSCVAKKNNEIRGYKSLSELLKNESEFNFLTPIKNLSALKYLKK